MYLRATVTYTDKFGSGKTASAVSAMPVEARPLANARPSFAEQDEDEATPYIDVVRSIPENTAVGMNVGSTVSATDADADMLFYELLDTPDLKDAAGTARFTIDSLSGQIRAGKALGADSCNGHPSEHEDEDSRSLTEGLALPPAEDPGSAGNGKYVLRVRASDPSTATATVNVIVAVTDVNEPPRFVESAPTVVRIRENADPRDSGAIVNPSTFAVTDQDCVDKPSLPIDPLDPPIVYSLKGDDLEKLHFIPVADGYTVGRLLDHEEQSSYSLTIVAGSGKGLRRLTVTLDVTLGVVDGEDPGEVSLSQREPQMGREVHTTVTDPDGGVRVSRWVWERSAPSAGCRGGEGGWEPIVGATSSAYTPKLADVGRCLRVTATYTDNIENAAGATDEREVGVSEAPVQSSNPANTAPHFVGQSGTASRRVFENTEARQDIGMPLSAHDEDGDLPVYTLSGKDAASFGIDRNSGQLKTRAPLNFEAKSSYTVTVTATDPSGAATGIPVTIYVLNRDEPARITGNRTVDFAENATAPVASFSAHDPERRSIRWSLAGRDAGLFTISRGTLRFRKSPNYEEPHSALEGAALAERNVYRVTVEASGGVRDVAVAITDVDEAGTASMDRPQPQADRPLRASLSDQDGGVTAERWQWARSEDGANWTVIGGAASPRRIPTTDDVGMYLRATVTYSDKFGPGKTASAVSANRVEARTLYNAAPSLVDQDEDGDTPYIDVTRSVAENTPVGTAIGEPLAAKDADKDALFYELLDTPDLEDEDDHARFTIDSLTGQIRVGEQLGADAGERKDEDSTAFSGEPALPDDEDADEADNSEYVLRVRVSDPSTASDTVNVIVTVKEVNEPPAFDDDAPTLLRVRENQKDDVGNPVVPPVINLEDGARVLNDKAFAATDQDGDDTAISYTLSGADRSAFSIDGAGTLNLRAGHKPDFERKSSYAITIVARSGEGTRGLTATLDVRINVVDAEDPGTVLLSERQPEPGIEILATLSDPDGGVIIGGWVWERSAEEVTRSPSAQCRVYQGSWAPIDGAASAVYDPQPADVGRCLRVTATYADNLSVTDQRARGVSEVPVGRHRAADPDSEPEGGFVNAAPVFPDQDFLTEGDQSDTTSREVAENTKAGQSIGDPVWARDDDGDLLIYTLGGADAGHFDISRNDGQLKTRAPLNYEDRNVYTVVVTATDPFGAADSIEVTINVTDEDDPAVITIRGEETNAGP